MGGEDVAQRFETLQLHAGELFRFVGTLRFRFKSSVLLASQRQCKQYGFWSQTAEALWKGYWL